MSTVPCSRNVFSCPAISKLVTADKSRSKRTKSNVRKSGLKQRTIDEMLKEQLDDRKRKLTKDWRRERRAERHANRRHLISTDVLSDLTDLLELGLDLDCDDLDCKAAGDSDGRPGQDPTCGQRGDCLDLTSAMCTMLDLSPSP